VKFGKLLLKQSIRFLGPWLGALNHIFDFCSHGQSRNYTEDILAMSFNIALHRSSSLATYGRLCLLTRPPGTHFMTTSATEVFLSYHFKHFKRHLKIFLFLLLAHTVLLGLFTKNALCWDYRYVIIIII